MVQVNVNFGALIVFVMRPKIVNAPSDESWTHVNCQVALFEPKTIRSSLQEVHLIAGIINRMRKQG